MRNQLGIFLCLIFMAACSPNEEGKVTPFNSDSAVNFTELSVKESGLDFNNQLKSDTKLNIFEYLYYYNGGGVGVGDFDNDGLEDIFFTANQTADKLYKNLGSLQFKEISAAAGIQNDNTWSSGVAVVDIDNDKDLDIYVSKVAPFSKSATHNLLYINDGTGQFTEQSKSFGLDFSGYGTQALFLDFDLDGDVDVYLVNHSVHSVASFGDTRRRKKSDPLAGDRLFQNQLAQGKSTFIDVTETAGIFSSSLGYGLSGAIHDFNDDGYPDIYVCNDFHENDYLYLNNKNGTFKESISEFFPQTSKFTMGIDVADINADGQLDVFTTDMLPWDKEVAMRSAGEDAEKVFEIRESLGFETQYARNHLHINEQDRFVDLALFTKTYATDWSWAVLCQDFDHNGLNDLFITNGIVKRPNDLEYMKFLNKQGQMLEDEITEEELKQTLDIMPTQKLTNVLFQQNAPLDFSDIQNAFVGQPTFSNGAAYADFDLDGDLDLVTNNIDQTASLYRNDTNNPKYISFKFDNNKSTLGASVTVKGENIAITKVNYTVRGFQSSSTQLLHFPLTATSTVDSVIVSWPDRKVKLIRNLELNQTHLLSPEMGESFNQNKSFAKNKLPFEISNLPLQHLDNEYADYDHDILIPEKLSSEGPTIHAADFNGDGVKDLYVGGGRFAEAKLLLGKSNGQYKEQENLDFKKDAKHEDVAATSLDFDGDGDLDLYVVSGGNDVTETNPLLQDRLYLNDGKGNLKRLPISLPFTNGSTISTGDINGDGFPDLFVGARSIPNAYGLSPYSFLLSNKGGFGLEMIWKKRLGMVTDSKMLDLDGDDDIDLVISGDWMSILVGLNNGESLDFENEFAKSIQPYKGLWNCLAFEDLNDDGIQDIVAGNAGMNFKWTASEDVPTWLYVFDIDKNSSTESFIFNSYFDQYMPFHALDRMIEQVPALKKDFINYPKFAEVESIDQLTNAEPVETKQLTELRSILFISGKNGYKHQPLADEFQYTAIKDAEVWNDQLIILGNEDRFIAELGANNGWPVMVAEINKGDKISISNPKTLDLDPTLATRQLIVINKSQAVFTVDQSKPFLLNRRAK